MAKRKNVLLILSDQQRMDTVGAYGMNDICKTPHIDQLAAEGMKFNNAYTPSAICAPARASVMTGLYPHKHGVIDNFTNIKEGTPLLGECMRDAGYYCGSQHVGGEVLVAVYAVCDGRTLCDVCRCDRLGTVEACGVWCC